MAGELQRSAPFAFFIDSFLAASDLSKLFRGGALGGNASGDQRERGERESLGRQSQKRTEAKLSSCLSTQFPKYVVNYFKQS